MNAKKRSNAVMTTAVKDGIITITVIGGTGPIEFDPSKCAPAMRTHAEFHGWVQRLADGAAGKKTGPDKFAGVKSLADYYMSGATEWKRRGERTSRDDLIIQAIMNVRGKSRDEIVAIITNSATAKKCTNSDILASLANDPRFAAEVVRLSGAVEVDTGDLFD